MNRLEFLKTMCLAPFASLLGSDEQYEKMEKIYGVQTRLTDMYTEDNGFKEEFEIFTYNGETLEDVYEYFTTIMDQMTSIQCPICSSNNKIPAFETCLGFECWNCLCMSWIDCDSRTDYSVLIGISEEEADKHLAEGKVAVINGQVSYG
jgi:hypothetical protein